MLYKIHERREPNILTAFRAGEVDLAINVVDGHVRKEVDDDYAIRRYAVDHGIPLLTKIKQARLFGSVGLRRRLGHRTLLESRVSKP